MKPDAPEMETKKNHEDWEKELNLVHHGHGPNVAFVDRAQIWPRPGNLLLVRLFCGLPPGFKEEVRFVGTIDWMKDLIQLICKLLDWYPTRPEATDAISTADKPKK